MGGMDGTGRTGSRAVGGTVGGTVGGAVGGAEEAETEVVVVGAGPAGLALAYELALAGVGTLVLERLPRRVEQVKGGTVQPRTAELLDQRGLLEPLLRRATAREPVGGHFAMLPVSLDCAPWHTRHPYPVAIPQGDFEAVLEEQATARGARVLRGATVTAVTPVEEHAGRGGPDGPDGEGSVTVTVTTRTDGGGGADGGGAGECEGVGEGEGAGEGSRELRVRARYVVACDGGRSTVRKLLGLPFPGRPGTFMATLTDVRLSAVSELVPRERGHISGLTRQSGGYWTMLVPVEGDRYRFTYSSGAQQEMDRDAPVSEEEVAAALRTVFGEDTVLAAVDTASRFSDATRQLEQYRAGRVLFAGDAAHIHSPLGGQGLNLGVQDAFNLGWKLAAAVQGRAPEGLLDSYHTERHPVAAQVLHHTSAQRVLADPAPSEDVRALREIVVDLLRLPDANRHLAGLMSGLSLRYELPGSHPLTGRRVPDAGLVTAAGPTRLSALFRTGRAVLLDLAGIVPDDLKVPDGVELVRAEAAEGDAGVPAPDAAALLVRPDGYICWAADDASTCRAELLPAIGRSLMTLP